MAIGTTLNEIIEMTRNESKLSSNSSRGSDMREHIIQLIKRHYQVLADSYDWQHLELKRNEAFKACNANQRYYDFPTNLNTDKIDCAKFKFGGTWGEMDYGISLDDYNSQDSEAGQTSNIVLKWDYYGLGQFEVWPMPSGSDGIVSFVGQKKITPLTTDDARADLDDLLIALMASSEILAGNGQRDAAKIKADAAVTRLQQMRAGKADKTRIQVGIGEVSNTVRRPRSIDFVR